ncbi:uncharacterized protein PFL1_05710 [Pseudozyma flocculosa PF-1]|uniref:FHA domain-containing protein n=1 Tax=Pseudozyma flocculosa PF-1 TaxID=1277687 RepID=A0A061H7Z6_9BASI|nr:uncharacterized protein PFL1_05710 [Pseudozyma flocculosa PF-1]EPQ26731.1 hypothetical protein PFL1_05710 [Pseudozyma flocculosa PF-1]
MQSLIGGQAMANAPSNLGTPAGQGAGQQAGSQMHLANGHNGAGGAGSFGTVGGSMQNGAGGAGSAGNTQNLVYPALHLHPLNDTFAPKQINLAPPGPNNRIKIGRQTNAKTVPNPSNGYFDSKVLSRMHAEVWCQDGKVFIKDVRSSNGTFINGERLSPEAQESDVFELHNEDMVEFGIDIVGDDSKTIIHHKVACRVYLVITAEDALGLRNDFASLYRGGVHGGPLGNNGVGPGAEGGLRRGKAGFSFDHVLSKLQNELQRSKEQWNDLGSLTTTMHDIHETLGGGAAPMANPPYQHMVPPLPSTEAQSREAAESASKHAQTIAGLQAQLTETQASLTSHVDKIKSLEEMLSEHASIKAEVGAIKMQMEQAKREMELATERGSKGGASFGARLRQLDDGSVSRAAPADDDDLDDGMSVASMDTVLAGDDAGSAATLRRAPDGHVGPRAPPDLPPGVEDPDKEAREQASEGDAEQATAATAAAHAAGESASATARDDELRAQNAALSARLDQLSKQLESALALSEGLQSQHAQVTETVKVLESRVRTLEKEVEQKVGRVEGTVAQAMEGRWTEWRQEIEEGWRREREGWESEREELRKVVKAWDEANRRMEDELNGEFEGAVSASAPHATSSSVDAAEMQDAAAGPSSSASDGLRSKEATGGKVATVDGAQPRNNGNGRRSKRKRHVNSALRSLLYGSSGAGTLVNGSEVSPRFGSDGEGQDEGDGESSRSAGSRAGRWSDDEGSSSGQTRSVADSTSTRPSVSTGITSPGLSPANSVAGRKYGNDGGTDRAVGAGSGRGELGPHGGRYTSKDLTHAGGQTISAAAAGVVVVGVAAWVLAGKSGIAFSIPASAKV